MVSTESMNAKKRGSFRFSLSHGKLKISKRASCSFFLPFALVMLITCIPLTRLSPTSFHSQSIIFNFQRHDWDVTEEPKFCRQLHENPMPFSKDCDLNHDLTCKNNPKESRMFSTGHQDFYLYTQHFKKLRRPGVYIDIATNDPIKTSNTYFFDRCLRWSGICAEANHYYFESIFRQRSCQLVPTCLGSRDKHVVSFQYDALKSGILGDNYKFKDKVQNSTRVSERKRLMCTTMQLVLDRLSLAVIDLLSLDVEGFELEVLKGIDLHKVTIKVITIELSESTVKPVEEHLRQFGYYRHEVNRSLIGGTRGFYFEDVMFLHRTVEFGSPR